MLRFGQVKKKRGVSRSEGKQSASKKAAKRKGAKPNRAQPPPRRGAARFPVRGSRNAGVGIRSRAAIPETPIASRGDLTEVRALAVAAMEAALDKKALLPVLIDVSSLASYTDFIGIVSGRSDRQVEAIADNICEVMKGRGKHLLGQEGTGSGRWTLLDFGSFVIHVFYHPVREFYDLESLWIDAPRVKLDVPPEAALPEVDAYYGAL